MAVGGGEGEWVGDGDGRGLGEAVARGRAAASITTGGWLTETTCTPFVSESSSRPVTEPRPLASSSSSMAGIPCAITISRPLGDPSRSSRHLPPSNASWPETGGGAGRADSSCTDVSLASWRNTPRWLPTVLSSSAPADAITAIDHWGATGDRSAANVAAGTCLAPRTAWHQRLQYTRFPHSLAHRSQTQRPQLVQRSFASWEGWAKQWEIARIKGGPVASSRWRQRHPPASRERAQPGTAGTVSHEREGDGACGAR